MAPQRRSRLGPAGTTPLALCRSPAPQSLLVPGPRGARVAWAESALLPTAGGSAPAGGAQGSASCGVPRTVPDSPHCGSLGVCVCKVRRRETAGISGFFRPAPEAIQAGNPNSCVPGKGRVRAGPFSVDAPASDGGSWPGTGYARSTEAPPHSADLQPGEVGPRCPISEGPAPACPPCLEVFEGAGSQEGHLVGGVWQAPSPMC